MNYQKMIIAILQGEDYPDVVKDLNKHGFYVTLLNSTGGFLKKHSVTLMIGVEEEKLETATEIIKKHCSARRRLYRSRAVSLHRYKAQPESYFGA